ncbi:MAG TPA: hypothetical protein VN802_08640 [Stellaceae bacterium]|nr:hypothetical protein [Stellaceae bacterium]
MKGPSIFSLAMAALVLVSFALAMSRRNLFISAVLCFLALFFIVVAFIERAMVQ